MRRLGASWLAARRHRGQKGQTLVIMAFLSVFLITLLGLVVDSVRLYILSAQAERAAEAAALAGALYMPNYFNTASPDGEYAVNRACEVLLQNGISNCPAAAGQVGGHVSTVAGNPYEIQVTVTLQADVFFLAFVAPNLTTTTISRSALAEFLPPIQLGSRSATFGDQIDPGPPQSFWASINGPYDLKEQGDAYTPTWEEGPTDPIAYPDGGSYCIKRWTPASCGTNHQQWPAPIANPDQHPQGFTGAAGTEGYNYQIIVPPGAGNIQVKIYNPAFVYDTNFCTTGVAPANSTGDTVDIDASRDPAFGCGHTDKKNEYLQMTYSLYSAPLLFERAADTLLTSFQPASLDAIDAAAHACGAGLWDPQGQQCVTKPSYVDQWYTLYTITQPGTYRLSVEATGYYGAKNYGIKLTTNLGGAPPAGTRVFAWNDMCVYFTFSGTDSVYDLGEIPADYAGKTLTFSLFDPGESNKNIEMRILDPSGNPVQLPAWVRTSAGSNGTKLLASSNGDHIYNGLWLRMPIAIPANYNPAPGSDWWQIEYITSANSTPTDKITISISLSGSPIHLVNEIP